jgi:type IX secretion system PorP/SprF family membrane protein
MRYLVCILLLSAVVSFPLDTRAQDPQFSQFYAAPLYLNPGFTGTTPYIRGGANFRSQWPSLDANFTTYSFYMDYYAEEYNSGLGLLITTDKEGLANLTSTSVGLLYAYELRINEKFTFRPGVQAAYVLRDINFNKLTFGDQYDETGFLDQPTAEQFNTGENIGFVDFSFGGLLFSRNFWFGIAAHHLNTPNQSLVDGNSELPIKYSIHSGYRFPLPTNAGRGYNSDGKERSITPNFQYKLQGEFDQLEIGTYLTFEPIVFGMWYRGIPLQEEFDGFNDKESLIFLVGLTAGNLNIGYSFDYTISELGIASGGAHEISLSYQFPPDPRRPPKNVRRIPCPKF